MDKDNAKTDETKANAFTASFVFLSLIHFFSFPSADHMNKSFQIEHKRVLDLIHRTIPPKIN